MHRRRPPGSHAASYGGSEARRDELQRTVAALDATVRIARVLGGQTDLATIVELVAKRGRTLVSARAFVVGLVRGPRVEIVAGAGDVPRDIVGREVSLEHSVVESALRRRRPQRLDDEVSHARLDEADAGRLGLPASAGLVVPLMFSGRAVGVLLALDRLADGPQFTADDERMLEAFAVSAGAAVTTAQSVATERRGQRLAAAEQERARWARELHDGTLQSLAGLRLGLSAARRSEDPAELDAAVGQALVALQDEIANLRALITELRPPALDQLGPKAALASLAARAAGNGLIVDARVSLAYEEHRRSKRHPPELETALYRIVQESLTNATKHGGASHAVVEVRERETAIEVTISDDGTGFDAAEPTRGFGLLGMRERAELLHGTLRIESAPGRGTVVRATLPVREEVDDDAIADIVPLRRAGDGPPGRPDPRMSAG